MIHAGIDHHKKYSSVVTMDDHENVLWQGRLASTPEAFRSLKDALPSEQPVQSVLEAGRNWGPLFDTLEALEMAPHLANPAKSRLIAESFQKTDAFDARTLSWMLKAGIVPEVHVPVREVRDQKNLLRQRLWFVRCQSALKNRIHNLLDRNHAASPAVTDLFGRQGRAWLDALTLPEPDTRLLAQDLALLDTLRQHIRDTERWIQETLKDNALIPVLETLPGIGKLLAALIALEVDTVRRFPTPEKFCRYAGVVSSTYSSGGKTFHGGLIPTANRFLRYAFIEAAWTAARTSPYFAAYFRRMKTRVGSHKAIGACARKLAEITFHCLTKNRAYEERPYRFVSARPGTFLAGR